MLLNDLFVSDSNFSGSGVRGGLEGVTAPLLEASSQPLEEILTSRRRKFGKKSYENSIFRSF